MKTSLRILFATAFTLSLASCTHYQRYGMAKSRLQKINTEVLSIYLIDAAHPMTRGWYLSEPTIEETQITGYISRMAEVETLEIVTLRGRTDAVQSRNDVLIYLKPQFANTLPDASNYAIPHAQLEKIEVCELDQMRSIGMPLLGCTGLLLVLGLSDAGD